MDSQASQLHIAFFPFLAAGHIIPAVEMARLFSRRGVKATIITTPLNATLFSETIERERQLGSDISILTIKFPSEEAGLPEGCENASAITNDEMVPKFHKAAYLLQQPFEHLLQECRPSCLAADMMYPWAKETAAKFEIPRVVFNGFSTFSLCLLDSIYRYEPHKSIESDFEPFILPGLPDQITMTRSQLPPFLKVTDKISEEVFLSDKTSYGVLINSFKELEPAYAEYYKKVRGVKAWHIGPMSLRNRDIQEKVQRGNITAMYEHECLAWLDSKKPKSVLYICFGSLFHTSKDQLLEIAKALEACGHNFIWVVGNVEQTKNGDKDAWLPEGFEEKIEGRGLIIRGWAPQVLILDHEAVGGFITHCGWNSILEGVTAGVPMITWPLHSEQFLNEKLVTEVLKVGIAVGAKECAFFERKILVKKEEIEKAVKGVMAGEEAEGMRNRAIALKEAAKNAIEEGGSSGNDVDAFLEELRAIKTTK